MKAEKDRLIENLKKSIENDNYWLTRHDQQAILLKIDQLNEYIENCYEMHMPKKED